MEIKYNFTNCSDIKGVPEAIASALNSIDNGNIKLATVSIKNNPLKNEFEATVILTLKDSSKEIATQITSNSPQVALENIVSTLKAGLKK